MTMVTPNRGMAYTVIPLDRLDEIRAKTHETFRALTKTNGKTYKIRTFYLGKRKSYNTTCFGATIKIRPASTPRKNATGAKIAIYEKVHITTKWGNYTQNNLIAYV
ncbi:hypothetical protein UFOVP787_80 [uncultured Caudovirales phage]|uniref:Uncharacterized protein n=1 Tax=uncultured Caudovirales phage TaxID=2100421 RepID=A0A6J5NZV9_9CAUD|nr:hypothetical protein UFOVP787_80 [uncultured Caudovirales phage]